MGKQIEFEEDEMKAMAVILQNVKYGIGDFNVVSRLWNKVYEALPKEEGEKDDKQEKDNIDK